MDTTPLCSSYEKDATLSVALCMHMTLSQTTALYTIQPSLQHSRRIRGVVLWLGVVLEVELGDVITAHLLPPLLRHVVHCGWHVCVCVAVCALCTIPHPCSTGRARRPAGLGRRRP